MSLLNNNNYIVSTNINSNTSTYIDSADIITQTNNLDEISKTLKTGDILLCDNLQQKGLGLFGWLIKYATTSDFSHTGMIVVDPNFTDPPVTGVYVWQSGTASIPDAEDNKVKIGVQLTPFLEFVQTYFGKIYLRRLHISIHNVSYNEEVCDDQDNNHHKNITIHRDNIDENDLPNSGYTRTNIKTTTKNIVELINPIRFLKGTINYMYYGYNFITKNIYNFYNPNHYLTLPYSSQLLTSSSSTSILPILPKREIEQSKKQHHTANPFTQEKMEEIHKVVYNKPYDIVIRDWIEAYFKNDPHPQKISRFWCSALVAFIYTKVGLFDSRLDWSIIRPSFFSSENPDLNDKYLVGAYLTDETLIWCSSRKVKSS
jgi:hypothetical protein